MRRKFYSTHAGQPGLWTGWAMLLAASLTAAGALSTADPAQHDAGLLADLAHLGMSATWWKSLSRRHTRALRSRDGKTVWQALQHVLFFATRYPHAVDFRRAVPRLLETYRFDENEAHRILALAALHAIGSEDAMQHLAQHVHQEASARVRRLTQAVLADFFKPEEEDRMLLFLAG